MATVLVKRPLQGRAFWEHCAREVERRLDECQRSREGYIAIYHYRRGATRQEAIALYEMDLRLLELYRERAAAGKSRRPRYKKHVAHALESNHRQRPGENLSE